MIKYILIISSTLILIITYQLFENKKVPEPIIKIDSKHEELTIKPKPINTINQAKKVIKKDLLHKDKIPIDLTYDPLLNKIKNKTISNEEFKEIEKNIRNKTHQHNINTDIPYNNDLSLDAKYDEPNNTNPSINLSSTQLREYESDLTIPQNNISYEDEDEDILDLIKKINGDN